MAIIFKCDVLKELSAAGYSTYRIRKEKLLSEGAMTRIRNNQNIEMTTLDTLCRLLGKRPGDIIDYVED